ncbi:protein O-linked-mannose beta-1,4-N-acetylglucosaminyltransferase 2-like [Tubulanus polymorphus]|uniref:protein O-linked-mannose beta-1,4-N-acetylglucosaminyltransferase 2-like n=1 Tax=Tubulanus polymorphus TaxID=672921 RepID=UPI003DA2C0DD
MIRHGCVIQLVLAVLTAFILKLFFSHVGTDDNAVKNTDHQQTSTATSSSAIHSIQPSGTVNKADDSLQQQQQSTGQQYISISKTSVSLKSAEVSYKSSFDSLEKILPTEKPATLNERKEFEELRTDGSSVWCYGSDHTNRNCEFHNLCYSPTSDSFIFYHSTSSVVHGVPADRFDPTLLDSSTIKDHNALYFNYIDLPVIALSEIRENDFEFVKTTSHLIGRFNGGNLMHVLHDELVPLFYTYSQKLDQKNTKFAKNLLNIQVIFYDKTTANEYMSLYNAITIHAPISRTDMFDRKRHICFSELHVGLRSSLTWYDFGLYKPQRPIADTALTGRDLRRFGRFLRTNLAAAATTDRPTKLSFKNYVVLLSRKENRLIINENDLVVAVAREFNVKVISASLTTHTVNEIIQLVSRARGVIAVHGSLLVTAMFLPRGSFVLELFPYAIEPSNYTPYKTLCELPGVDLKYAALRNTRVESTVAYPDNEKHLGGLQHLSESVREQIMTRDFVPSHLCCNDPAWLYRIYQDTHVNIAEVLNILRELTNDQKHEVIHDELFPAPVTQIRCRLNTEESVIYLDLFWSPPMNLKYLQYFEVKYEVWLQVDSRDEYKAWFTTKTDVKLPVIRNTTYNLWIRCLIDSKVGPFNEHKQCST